jgi:hypothetical protein
MGKVLLDRPEMGAALLGLAAACAALLYRDIKRRWGVEEIVDAETPTPRVASGAH